MTRFAPRQKLDENLLRNLPVNATIRKRRSRAKVANIQPKAELVFNKASDDETEDPLMGEHLRQRAETRTDILNDILAHSEFRLAADCRLWGINEY
jgi:hypothetical protein